MPNFPETVPVGTLPKGSREKLNAVKLLVLQGTPFCNIDCRYCYLPDRKSTGQMSVSTVEAVIENLLRSELLRGPVLVNWHAGEPLVLPPEFYRQRIPLFAPLKEAGIEVTHSLQTNAMLVSDAHCEMFKEFNVRVGVSIDGPAEIHDAKRVMRDGRGSHSKVVEGIARLQEHGVPFNVICVLSDLSVRNPDKIYQFFKERGVRAVGFNIEEIEGVNLCSSITTPGFDQRYRSFIERLWDLVQADNGVMRIREFDDAEGRILDMRPRRNSQAEPFINMSVGYNGDFSTFCPELLGNRSPNHPDFVFGNVHESLIRDIIYTEKFQNIYGEISAGVALCREGCSYFDVCGGGNPSNKMAENGSFISSETINCRNRIKATCEFVLTKIESRVNAVADTRAVRG